MDTAHASAHLSATGVRERIVAAAMRVIQDEGIHVLTQARVSAEAGIRQSHLTYYFPTRIEMLQQVVIAGTESILDTLYGPDGSHVKSITQLRTLLLKQLFDKRMARLLCAVTAASEEEPALKRWLDQRHLTGIERLRKALVTLQLAPPAMELELFRATLVGLFQISLWSATAAGERRARSMVDYALDRLIQACQDISPKKQRRQAAA